MVKEISIALILFLVAFFVTCFFSDLGPPEMVDRVVTFANAAGNSGKIDEIKIPADSLHALMVACEDWKEKLRVKYGDKSTAIIAHLSNINNYSVMIKKIDEGPRYRIHFAPSGFQGGPIKGGSVSYMIDEKTFQIMNIDYSM